MDYEEASEAVWQERERALREENARLRSIVLKHEREMDAHSMRDYPNISAIAVGTISGAFREWPRIREEAKELLHTVEDERKYRLQNAEYAAELQVEVARLREQCGTYFDNSAHDLEKIDTLTRERDEAREQVGRMADAHIANARLEAEVKRLEEEVRLTSLQRDQWKDAARTDLMEVKRLEGLILDWDEAWKGYPDAQNADLPLLDEARRIRAQRDRDEQWRKDQDACEADEAQREEGK